MCSVIDALQALHDFTGRPPSLGHLPRALFDEFVASLTCKYEIQNVPNHLVGEPFVFLTGELPNGGQFYAQRYVDTGGSS